MDPQNNIIEPTNKSHRIIYIVLTILLTAGVIGGSVYYVLDKQNKEQQKQIEELQKTQSAKSEVKTEPKPVQIEAEENKTETPVVKKAENVPDYAKDWYKFNSSNYGFSFRYPKETSIQARSICRNPLTVSKDAPISIRDYLEGGRVPDLGGTSRGDWRYGNFFRIGTYESELKLADFINKNDPKGVFGYEIYQSNITGSKEIIKINTMNGTEGSGLLMLIRDGKYIYEVFQNLQTTVDDCTIKSSPFKGSEIENIINTFNFYN